MNHKRLELNYQKYLNSLEEKENILKRKEFLQKLIDDDSFNARFGKNVTRLMCVDERLKMAYSDEEERMLTFMYMGTKHTKTLLNKLNIPRRKIQLKEECIDFFISNEKSNEF